MKRPIRQRCEQCGEWANPRQRDGRPPVCRTEHPETGLIDWPHPGGATAKRPLISVAYETLCRKSREGGDLERWIEESHPGEHAGASKGDLALALVYARRWALPEFNDSDLPELMTRPITLFGRRARVT